MMRQIRRRQAVLVVVLVLTTATLPRPQISHAAGIVVNSLADTAVAGDGQCTLREAMLNSALDTDTTSGDCAAGGSGDDRITFSASGTILLTANLPDENQRSSSDSLTMDGTGQTVILDGGHAYYFFSTSNGLTLIKLTLQNGYGGDTMPAGAVTTNDTLTITDCIFSGNTTNKSGGAIATVGGSTTITNSVFFDNVAPTPSDGGAIWDGGGGLAIINSTFYNNHGHDGGAIWTWESTLTVIGSTFYDNVASGNGGAIFKDGNQSQYDKPMTVTNSTFYNNDSGGRGGAIAVYENQSASEIQHTTFANNRALTGSAVFGNFTLKNTVIGDNPSDGVACAGTPWGDIVDGGGNVQHASAYCTLTIPVVPLDLGSFGDHGGPTFTIPLLAGSGAIGVGVPSVCAAAPVSGKDQRGMTRKAACDSGAYETGQ